MKLYPLFFEPILKYRLWGGNKLRTELNKDFEGGHIGESWEISNVDNSKTRVKNGHLAGKTLTDLIELYGSDLLGASVLERFGKEFPLLIKFLDANKPLSIQVHPNDEIAKRRHNASGKNEMWYIMQAEQDAEIIVGFKEDSSKEAFSKAIEKGELLELLNKEKVSEGDLYHIPAGRIHAIGAGVLLAEIQQTSDVTYRVYDYNRIDSRTGVTRELHQEQAIEVLDYKGYPDYRMPYQIAQNNSTPLLETPFFKTRLLQVEGLVVRDYSHNDSFTILMCVEGEVDFIYADQQYHFSKGQTLLLPAIIDQINFQGTLAKILEVSV